MTHQVPYKLSTHDSLPHLERYKNQIRHSTYKQLVSMGMHPDDITVAMFRLELDHVSRITRIPSTEIPEIMKKEKETK